MVQLPGMMTGMIIAGVSPIEAVKYQLLILLIKQAHSNTELKRMNITPLSSVFFNSISLLRCA